MLLRTAMGFGLATMMALPTSFADKPKVLSVQNSKAGSGYDYIKQSKVRSSASIKNVGKRSSNRDVFNLTSPELSFLNGIRVGLNEKQLRIVNDRASYISSSRGPGVTLGEGREGYIPMSSTQEKAAVAAGAKTMKQILDHTYYGDFLPSNVEKQWSDVFR